MFEQQIIDSYRLKQSSGITELENCFYMPVRITGTGCTVRFDENNKPYIEERLKSEYFTPAVLKHCAALPITIEHPRENNETTLITPETIKDTKIIGQTIDSWIQDDEIWGLARIYDKSLISRLGNDLNSTSPGFSVFYSIVQGHKQTEGPIELNHLALVERGHWDQIEGSQGFDNSTLERIEMEQDLNTKTTESTQGAVIELNDSVEPVTSNAALRVDSADEENSSEGETMETEKVDNEVPEVLDEEIPEVLDDEVEILDNDGLELDEFGPEHHEQPSEHTDDADVEILDSEDDEIVVSDSEEVDDKERADALEQMRDACDSAHPLLKVKMPHIDKRETCRSVVSKFISRNRSFVPSKYQNLRLDSMNTELAQEVLNETLENIRAKSASFNTKPQRGFVPTRFGAVDANF